MTRCPYAIVIGTFAIRCDKSAGHRGKEHEGPGLARFPSQRVNWWGGDIREFETERDEAHAWEVGG